MNGQTRNLALDVPQRDVNATEHPRRDPASPDQLRPPHLVPDAFVVKRVHAD